VTADVIRQVAILAQPFMPESAAKFLELLAVNPEDRGFTELKPGNRIKAGVALPAPTGVFPRYVEPESEAEPKPQKKQQKPPKNQPKPGA
jgi:methionyl-tRNA synthetase